jgi:hypothetical protein
MKKFNVIVILHSAGLYSSKTKRKSNFSAKIKQRAFNFNKHKSVVKK